MRAIRTFLRVACATIVVCVLGTVIPAPHQGHASPLLAQSSADQPGSVELEQLLFVQAPEQDNGKGGIVVIWLPQPLQKLCLGKTASQCSNIDYCIRTTNRESSRCKNIGVNLAHISPYPPDTRPRRMMSIVLMYLAPTKFEQLQDFYKSAPKASLERISMSARVKARIRFTRKPDDDEFSLLEVLAGPPF
jgi:preprotein translocase subunit Sss1